MSICPKNKSSKGRRDKRRANWKMTAPALVKCSKCGELMKKKSFRRTNSSGTEEIRISGSLFCVIETKFPNYTKTLRGDAHTFLFISLKRKSVKKMLKSGCFFYSRYLQ